MTADLVCLANFSNRSVKQIYSDFLKNYFLTKEKVSHTFLSISHSSTKETKFSKLIVLYNYDKVFFLIL